MKTALLDVNVLVALLWPAQESHAKVQSWFKRRSSEGWATCPLTQAGFVRIVSNPAFSPSAVSPGEAAEALRKSLAHPNHEYWPADISYLEGIEPFLSQIVRHKQVSDAYLLGLAIHHGGSLVTMDRGVLELVPTKSQQRELVTLL
ncbi:MAG TPA: TA system VapC family ribonuclease toxin [Candidatus Acidoferrum sp.]|nr:TA system VapC family ribonuclease toxin [Candidatus Acidoferrum sp.]